MFGSKSLEQHREAWGCDGKQLRMLGTDEIEYRLPPGSMLMPLERAPSGHLVTKVDIADRDQ